MSRTFRNKVNYSFPYNMSKQRAPRPGPGTRTVEERANRRAVTNALKSGDWDVAMDAGAPRRLVGTA